jgi:UDPglucose 6-dehydrogenase
MRIGIIGGGVVGKATFRSWVEYAEQCRVYDIDPARGTGHKLEEVLDAELIFVCLPTPKSNNQLACDTSLLDQFFAPHANSKLNFVLRSTVPIGTTTRLREQYKLNNLVHYPEFLTARCSIADAHLPARNVIGGLECRCKVDLIRAVERRFKGTPLFLLTSEESEAVKLLTNGYFGVVISYFNEAFDLCQRLNMDWLYVLKAIMADGRIPHSHNLVPGPDKQRGFGGDCLPKDVANLLDCMDRAEVHPPPFVTRSAYERNCQVRGEPK